jgi:hypothetical protein
MKKVLLAWLALFALTAAPLVYAEDLPEVPADDNTVELPPMTDPASDTGEAS